MFRRLRSHVPIILTAVITGTVVAAGPTVARAAHDAVNADKVDGKHAVGASASPSKRAGKLVATNPQGRLPNNIIAKAPDADTLDGMDSSALRVTAGGSAGEYPNLNGCAEGAIVSYPLTLTRPTRILATASTRAVGDPELIPSITIELLDSADTVVASSNRVTGTLYIGEVLFPALGSAPYDAPAGTYTLRIYADNSGLCDNALTLQYQLPRLTHVLVAGGQ